jgi:hypothetical protein
MSPFDVELRECVGLLLGAETPVPNYEPARFFRHWLAEQNLGLVPIAGAAHFDWPGHWLARVHTADGDHAVVMFGSPSGPLHDPRGAIAAGGTIEEGWLLARLDPHLPIRAPYGAPGGAGTVERILVAADAEQSLRAVETVEAVAGRGLEGDRYFNGRGTFTAPGRGYELTLVEAEVLESVDLPWDQARRNIVTRGIELNPLVGQRFTIGAVECIGRRLAEPCAHLEKLARPGLLRPLVHRAGLRADIVGSGTITVGDPVLRSAHVDVQP